MSSSDHDVSSYLLFFSVSVLSLVWKWRQGNRKGAFVPAVLENRGQNHYHSPCPSGSSEARDWFYLQKAHQIRRAITSPPRHSQFRVVALLLLRDGETVLAGTNDEASPSIGGSICAERAALLNYRIWYYHYRRLDDGPSRLHDHDDDDHQGHLIDTVYIVTDAPHPVPPGTLCREYLLGHEAMTRPHHTRVVMQGTTELLHGPTKTTAAPIWIRTIAELYPFPSIYNRWNVSQQIQFGKEHGPEFARQAREVILTDSKGTEGIYPTLRMDRLWRASQEASQRDRRDDVQAIGYGAAAAILVTTREVDPPWPRQESEVGAFGSSNQYGHDHGETTTTSVDDDGDWHIVSACQLKAVEYGASQDALCQLAPLIRNVQDQARRRGQQARLVAALTVDQFGIPHAPFAPARSLWVEHGWGEAWFLLTERTGDLSRPILRGEEDMVGGNAYPGQVILVQARELVPLVPEFWSPS